LITACDSAEKTRGIGSQRSQSLERKNKFRRDDCLFHDSYTDRAFRVIKEYRTTAAEIFKTITSYQ